MKRVKLMSRLVVVLMICGFVLSACEFGDAFDDGTDTASAEQVAASKSKEADEKKDGEEVAKTVQVLKYECNGVEVVNTGVDEEAIESLSGSFIDAKIAAIQVDDGTVAARIDEVREEPVIMVLQEDQGAYKLCDVDAGAATVVSGSVAVNQMSPIMGVFVKLEFDNGETIEGTINTNVMDSEEVDSIMSETTLDAEEAATDDPEAASEDEKIDLDKIKKILGIVMTVLPMIL
ncbi:hypothetical protein KKA47_01890 [bacterium]|nr:hypothetical protein [bacterium]